MRTPLLTVMIAAIGIVTSPAFSGSLTFPSYLNRFPDNGTPNWGDNKTATQGIAHDDRNWFISASGTGTLGIAGNPDWILWRIPVNESLDQDFYNSRNPAVRHIRRTEVPVLHNLGAEHPGDLDYYSYNGRGYLLVPMRNSDTRLIAVFRADDLHFVDYFTLPQESIGWCAVTKRGELVTSEDDGDRLLVYRIDWERSTREGNFYYSGPHEIPFKDRDDSALLIQNVQGGEYSADGSKLYISSGVSYDELPTDGIHVFDAATMKVLSRSTNPEHGESSAFSYEFDNGATAPDEPEGLTYWDLDDGRAPGIRGQLHVLVFSWRIMDSHKVTLMHYSTTSALRNSCVVRLYEHPYFGGDSRSFSEDVADLDLGTINFADVASSVQIEGNCSVRLYDYRNYSGPNVEIRESVADLQTIGMNDRVGSLRIIASPPPPTPATFTPPSSYGLFFKGEANHTPSPPAARGPRGVRLFEHPNYQGDSRFFETDIPDLDLGTINFADVASSLQLVGIERARFYDGHYYTGESILVMRDIPDLRSYGWNDGIGSLKIER